MVWNRTDACRTLNNNRNNQNIPQQTLICFKILFRFCIYKYFIIIAGNRFQKILSHTHASDHFHWILLICVNSMENLYMQSYLRTYMFPEHALLHLSIYLYIYIFFSCAQAHISPSCGCSLDVTIVMQNVPLCIKYYQECYGEKCKHYNSINFLQSIFVYIYLELQDIPCIGFSVPL